jgi:tRNA pseudouridine55 synthase
MGCGAYLSALARTQCGVFKLDDAVTPPQLESAVDWRAYLLPMDAGLQHWPRLQLTQAEVQHIRHGLTIATDMAEVQSLVRAYDHTGQLFALLKHDSHQRVLRPEKVFSEG